MTKDNMEDKAIIERQQPYAYWLDNIPGVGKVKIRQLLEKAGTPENVYYMTIQETKELLTDKQLQQYLKQKQSWNLYTEFDKLEKMKIRFVPCQHPEYPSKLSNIPDAPYAIYVKGRLPDAKKTSVAVIGARMCSEYGRFMAREFGVKLAEAGIQVISGLARGVDGISQKGAIEAGGQTFGILGCGVDICYPSENEALYQKMIMLGGVLSEYVPGTMPKANYFPPRNRIISGLSDAVLIIEAKQKSGTLITVDMALEQGKEVYALPGRTTDALSNGCNRLIKQGAGIALSAEDFIEELYEQGIYKKEAIPAYKEGDEKQCIAPAREIGELGKRILNLLDFNPQSIEMIYEKAIVNDTAISIPILLQELLQLQMKGIIAQIGVSYYIICK